MTGLVRLGSAIALVVGVAAGAQPRPGDFAVAFDVNGTSAVGTLDRSGALTTLVTGGFVGEVQRVRVAPGNRSLLVLSSDNAAGALYRVTAGGTIATLFTMQSGFWTDFTVDQDGSVIALGLFRCFRLQGSTQTPLPLLGEALFRDPESIDLYFVQSGFSLVLTRYSRATGALATLGVPQAFPGRTTLEYDVLTGGLLFAGRGLWRIDRSSRMTTLWTPRDIVGLRADPTGDGFFVADRNAVYRMEPGGRFVAAWGNVTKLLDFDVWGARGVTATGPSTPSSPQTVSIDLPDSPNAAYVAALSFGGRRPGIPLGARTLRITPDSLFFATLGGGLPALTSGFVGRLDALGHAQAAFRIRADVPQGVVYTLGVAALNPAKPDGLDFAVTSIGVF